MYSYFYACAEALLVFVIIRPFLLLKKRGECNIRSLDKKQKFGQEQIDNIQINNK